MSFKDNFTREEKQNDLEYDLSAFWTFGATFLLIVMIPLLNNIKNCLFYIPEIVNEDKYLNCKCSSCKTRLDKYVSKKKKEQKGFLFVFKVLIFTFMLYLLYLSYEKIVQSGGQLKGFNPFEILEIDESADDKTIKRAFRRLSVTYHPDKNSNPDAKAKFIKITKAYEALTDPIAKENFKKYGNPDGAGNMRIGIALPPFVYDKKNHMPILVLFLIFIIFVLPIGFYYWYVTENSVDENGVRPENRRIYYDLLNENVLPRHMPFIIGSSIEFSNTKVTSDEIEPLNRLFKNYKDRFPKHNEKAYSFPNYKAICLIYNSIEKEIPLNDYLLEETNKVMCKVPDLIISMYKMAFQLTMLYYQYCNFNQRNAIKYLGLNCLKTIILFSQCAHQQLKLLNVSPFLQIPYFTSDSLSKIKK